MKCLKIAKLLYLCLYNIYNWPNLTYSINKNKSFLNILSIYNDRRKNKL